MKEKNVERLDKGRERIIRCLSAIEVRLDQMDPKGTERYEDDYDASGQLSFLMVLQGELSAANALIRAAAMEEGFNG